MKSDEKEAGASGECPADRLSDDCLSLIFHRIDWRDRARCERVSRRWNVAVNKKGWDRFHAFDNQAHPGLPGKKLIVLRNRFTSTLRELSLANVGESNLKNTLKTCPLVRHLRIKPRENGKFRRDLLPAKMPRQLVTLELLVSGF